MCLKADNHLISCRQSKKKKKIFLSLCPYTFLSVSLNAYTQIDAEIQITHCPIGSLRHAIAECMCAGYLLILSMLTASLCGAAHCHCVICLLPFSTCLSVFLY